MKKLYFMIMGLLIALTPLHAMEGQEDPLMTQINIIAGKSLEISEKMTEANSQQQKSTDSWGHPKYEDTYTGRMLREEAKNLIKQAEKIAEQLVLDDAEKVSDYLSYFPRGVMVKKADALIEPITMFYGFTGLGISVEILNSLREKSHPNFSKFDNATKKNIARNVQS